MQDRALAIDSPRLARSIPAEDRSTLAALEQKIRAGESARCELPGGGRLYVERPLRFLCVTRKSGGTGGRALERLVAGQAAYLSAGPDTSVPFVQELVRRLYRGNGEEQPGAYLVVELWEEGSAGSEDAPAQPAFGVARSAGGAVEEPATALARGLAEVRVGARQPSVERFEEPELERRITQSLAGGLALELPGLVWLGLAVRPVYRTASGLLFPNVLLQLTEQVTEALWKAAHAFTCAHTPDRPPHPHAMGTRTLLPAAVAVDQRMTKVARSFDFLRLVTPVDLEEAWRAFRRSNESAEPDLEYRPLPVDPEAVKRALFGVPIEDVDDPTLARLFRGKQEELDRKITMLRERGRRSFLHLSLLQYGGVEPWLEEQATSLLSAIPPDEPGAGARRTVDAPDMARRVEEEIDRYRQRWEGFDARVELTDDLVSALLVEQDRVLVDRQATFTPERAEALVHHEVGTHLVTYCNGRAQPLTLICGGLPGYDALQEGLAVLGEYLAGGLDRPRLRLLAARVVACASLCDGATFVETYRSLVGEHGCPERRAFSIALRVHRSGGLTKDAVYLRGFHQILSYLRAGGEIEALLVGKVGFDHLPDVKELRRRGILEPPRLEPRYFELAGADARLRSCRNGVSVADLVRTTR